MNYLILNNWSRIVKTALAFVCVAGVAWNSLDGQTNGQSSVQVPAATQPAGQLLDLHLQSKDRMFRGQIKILPSWNKVSLRFVNTSTGQDLGTYANVLENLTASKPTFKIYNHQDDIFSEKDMQDAKKDPAGVIEQKVVFYKDDNDPTLLNFASTFDNVGTIQVQVIQDGKQIAYGQTKLTADADFSSLIQTVDKTISGQSPAPIIDPTDPNDKTSPGNSLGLLVAEQPGSVANPGDIDSGKNDPKALVLPLHTGSAVPSSEDADLSLVTLRRPLELTSNSGKITLTVSAPSSVMIFNEDATHALTDYTVDLANPKGDLAKLATGNACIWVRGAAPTTAVSFTYTYTDSTGKVQATDKLQMSVSPSAPAH